MAIDDNKIYGIKGSQLKDLASKVNAKAESSSLATVATSGDYDDLTNKPTIPTVNNATLTIQKNSTTIDTFTANASADKTINITVPTKVSDVTNDAGYQNASDVSTAVGNETTARQAADASLQGQIDALVASSDVKDIVGTKADLDNYDTSTLGNNDIIKVLTDSSQSNATTYYRWSTSTSSFSLIGSEGPYYTKSATDTLLNAKANQSTTYTKSEVDTALAAKVNTSSLATVATTGSYNDLSNKPSLATVATSGSYNDLSNKPTIPTVNNATLTIQYNGTSAGTFTANASANKTISITPAVKVGSVLSTPSSVAYVNTANITDSAVTTAKIAAEAVTKAKLASDVTSIGENKELSLRVTLPVTAYNGTNYILSSGSQTFSGGRYLLMMPSVVLYVSSIDYQAHINYRIDGSTEAQISSWASWANETHGSMSFCIPLNLTAGTHTIEIGFGTNNASKALQVLNNQAIKAFITKVGF